MPVHLINVSFFLISSSFHCLPTLYYTWENVLEYGSWPLVIDSFFAMLALKSSLHSCQIMLLHTGIDVQGEDIKVSKKC
jgi:hypothetical protein